MKDRPFSGMHKKNAAVIVLLLLFFIGMIYGVFLLKSGTENGLLSSYASGSISSMLNRTAVQNFFSFFLSVFLYLLASYILGYSAIAQPVLFLIPLLRGLMVGGFMGYLYSTYGMSGFGYSLLAVVPAEAVALFTISIACRESLRLSGMLFSEFRKERAVSLSQGVLRLFHTKYLILCLFALVSAFLETVGVLLFAGLFHIQ